MKIFDSVEKTVKGMEDSVNKMKKDIENLFPYNEEAQPPEDDGFLETFDIEEEYDEETNEEREEEE